MKLNCWEAKRCGREPGGSKAEELGVCPVTTDADLSGGHGGRNAGRACWIVAGSLCGGKIQGTYAKKLNNCWRCEFMNLVKKEEEPEITDFQQHALALNGVWKKSTNLRRVRPDGVIRRKAWQFNGRKTWPRDRQRSTRSIKRFSEDK